MRARLSALLAASAAGAAAAAAAAAAGDDGGDGGGGGGGDGDAVFKCQEARGLQQLVLPGPVCSAQRLVRLHLLLHAAHLCTYDPGMRERVWMRQADLHGLHAFAVPGHMAILPDSRVGGWCCAPGEHGPLCVQQLRH